MSDLSNLLTSLTKKEGMSESLIFQIQKTYIKHTKKYDLGFFSQNLLSESLLIYHEQPERVAHGCSFVMSDLSNLLMVAYSSWAIWAYPSQSLIWFERNEQMSECPALIFRSSILKNSNFGRSHGKVFIFKRSKAP